MQSPEKKKRPKSRDFYLVRVSRHNPEYDFSHLPDVMGATTPLQVACPTHGVFISDYKHLMAARMSCPGCQQLRKQQRDATKVMPRDEFIQKSRLRHGPTKYGYQYLPVGDFSRHTWIDLVCSLHGRFTTKAQSHLRVGESCPKCIQNSRDKKYKSSRHTLGDFVAKAQKRHGDFYDYSETVYTTQMAKLSVRCPIHGPFTICANNHIHGIGCASCSRSHGELQVEKWLRDNGFTYECQKVFRDLIQPVVKKLTRRFRFDFFLPELNTVIEYDGLHHFKPVPFQGIQGDRAVALHLKTVAHDKLKTAYCLEKGIALIRIRFDEKVESVLATYLKKEEPL